MSRLVDAWQVLTRGRDALKAANARPRIASWGWVDGTGQRFIPSGSQHDYQREAGDLWRSSVVSIAIGWITRQFLQAPFGVGYKDAEGQYVPDDRFGLVPVLERCNEQWPGRQTWAGVIGDFAIYGNAFMYKARAANSLPVELFWLPARNVTVKTDADGNINGYRYSNSGGVDNTYAVDDVIHFRDAPDPDNPIVGLGRVQSQVRNVAAINAGERWTASVLRNGTAGKIVSPKVSVEKIDMGGLPDEAALEATARVIRQRNGREAAGGVSAVSLPVDLLEAGESPEKMLVDRILDRPESMILAALGLNALALDLPSSASTRTYANKAEARREAWEHCVIPIQDAIADTLTRRLVQADFDPGLEVWFDRKDISALREDADSRMNRAVQAFSNTLVKRNPALEIAGLDPLPPEDTDGELYYGEATAAQLQQQADQMAQQQAMMGTPLDAAQQDTGANVAA